MDVDIGSVLLFGAVSLCSASVAVLIGARIARSGAGPAGMRAGPIVIDAPHVYEFSEGYLVSLIDPGDPFLDPGTDRSRAMEILCHLLGDLTPDFSTALANLTQRGEAFLLTAPLAADALSLGGRRDGDRLVLTVAPLCATAERRTVDAAALADLHREAAELRKALDRSDTLAWKSDTSGAITWCNAAYIRALDRSTGASGGAVWPLSPLFDAPPDAPLAAADDHREQLSLPDGAAGPWYRLESDPEPDGGHLWLAYNIDRIVAAEQARQNVIQTLSKTFAHMTTGLAVFDRTRRLVLFNPALSTITALDPIHLSARPGLGAFLDALREKRRIPEPRDYKTWRREMEALERDSAAGTYQQLWSLPDGQTLRVIGRPHPDGAMALFFEDISSEMQLTRTYRERLTLLEAVVAADPAAVMVFDRDGRLVLSNNRHDAIWPGAGLGQAQRLHEAVDGWRVAMQGGADLDAVIAAVTDPRSGLPFKGCVSDAHGRRVHVVCQRIVAGALEVRLAPEMPVRAPKDHRRSALDLARRAALADAAQRGDGVARTAPPPAPAASRTAGTKITP